MTEVASSSLDSTSVICFCTAPPQAERDVGAKRRNPERPRHARPRSGISPPSRLPVKPAMTTKAAGKYASQRHKVSCASHVKGLAQLTLCWQWPYIAPIFWPRFKLILFQGIIKEKRKQVVLLPFWSAVELQIIELS